MPDFSVARQAIRTARNSDLTAVINLSTEHAAFEGAEFNPAGLQGRLALAIAGSAPRLVIFLAEIQAIPVGYAAVTREYSTWRGKEYLHMDCLFIREPHRGKQFGHALFDAVCRHAAATGADEVQWQSPDWNHNAIRFYHSLGAASTAKQRFTFDLLK